LAGSVAGYEAPAQRAWGRIEAIPPMAHARA
jgi:hypothetical protein